MNEDGDKTRVLEKCHDADARIGSAATHSKLLIKHQRITQRNGRSGPTTSWALRWLFAPGCH